MEPKNADDPLVAAFASLSPPGHISRALDGRRALRKRLAATVSSGKLPDEPYTDADLRFLLSELAALDSNARAGTVGCGEREGRVFSQLVLERSFGLSHGIGRSGDVAAPQPKAAGSSILANLASRLARDAIRLAGCPPAACDRCLVVPCATGMTLSLCMRACSLGRGTTSKNASSNSSSTSSLSSSSSSSSPNTATMQRPSIVVMARVDQKACVKAVSHAGYDIVVVEPEIVGSSGDSERSDPSIAGMLRCTGPAVRAAIEAAGGPGAVVCVLSSASAFAPRVPDDLAGIAAVCAEAGVPHIINNAFGVQSTVALEEIGAACRAGRVDAYVQSTDKNFMVPVGGAVVASPRAARGFIDTVAQCYPGRASASPLIDLALTFLAMGSTGWKTLLADRKALYARGVDMLRDLAGKHGLRVVSTPRNRVSIVLSLRDARGRLAPGVASLTEIGSRLFTRAVTGVRVVDGITEKRIDGRAFAGFGAHCDAYPHAPYLTFSCAIGMTPRDLELGIKRVDAVLAECILPPDDRHAGARGEGDE